MEKYFRIGAAALAWFAILLQYYLTITKPGAPFIEATVAPSGIVLALGILFCSECVCVFTGFWTTY